VSRRVYDSSARAEVVQPANPREPKESALDVSIGPIKRFGRYTLIKKLATGGMAEIWLARQTGVAGFNRFVVIKKILPHLAEEETFRTMFLDEARMSALLSHPNIVQVYDLGEAETTYFIAMEFILGENLAAVAWRGVKRQRPLSPVFGARIMADACKALNYAHFLRGSDGKPLEIVHRDISPQNVLVTYEGEVKVVDFGIAKAASKSQHTKTGMLKGKFSYMSPEQCLGNPVDKRSDVFALGIVLYELCTGKRLFKHESELMILEMITKRRITPPSEVADNIPPELEQIIMRSLEKDASQRFQTGQDFQIALEDFIRSQNESATNADIAAYMRALFQDKIEEKRKLCEIASRDDFAGAAFEEEATDRAAQGTPVRRGRVSQPTPAGPRGSGLPSSVHVNGVYRAGGPSSTPTMHPMPMVPQAPGATPFPANLPTAALGQLTPNMLQQPALAGMMAQSASISAPGISGTITEERSWVPRIIILLALLVIVVAGTYLYQELTRDHIAQQPKQLPLQTGTIVLDSEPSGATIYVNNRTVAIEDGQVAKTPVDQLTNLVFGERYEIRLVKEGYEPWSDSIVMDETSNGRAIKATLKAIPGKLVVEVGGAIASDVRILLDGREQGRGPVVERELPAGSVHITADLEGYTCTATPEDAEIPPGGAVRATVRCREKSRVAAAPIREPTPRTERRTEPSRRSDSRPSPASAKGDCVTLDDVPPGFVTIDTTPYSEIFLDGKRLGETPLPKQKLPAGCVELVAKSKETGKEKKVRIKVEPNKNLRYKFDL
jgi:eukaryotic-like serine/threonine-protein kinase